MQLQSCDFPLNCLSKNVTCVLGLRNVLNRVDQYRTDETSADFFFPLVCVYMLYITHRKNKQNEKMCGDIKQ